MQWFNVELFLAVFSFIFLAELPDKTAMATLLMATRSRPFPVFFGVALAFVVQTLFAVIFGGLIGLLNPQWIHLGTGTLFLFFAYQTWRSSGETPRDEATLESTLSTRGFLATASRAFVVIFIAEWGDLTQIATASFAAHSKAFPMTVFLGALLALWSVTLLAVILGHRLKHLIDVKILCRISALGFLAVGFYFIWEAFFRI